MHRFLCEHPALPVYGKSLLLILAGGGMRQVKAGGLPFPDRCNMGAVWRWQACPGHIAANILALRPDVRTEAPEIR